MEKSLKWHNVSHHFEKKVSPIFLCISLIYFSTQFQVSHELYKRWCRKFISDIQRYFWSISIIVYRDMFFLICCISLISNKTANRKMSLKKLVISLFTKIQYFHTGCCHAHKPVDKWLTKCHWTHFAVDDWMGNWH